MEKKYKLVIVESPAKCVKIESYLGSDYKCIASYGHLRKLDNLNQIDVLNNFNTNYSLISEPLKIKQLEKIKKEIKNSSEIILATDDDREGEAIAWHICELFSLPISTTKRIVFHEITKNAILEAIRNPKLLNMDLITAQKTRQILDLLVGYTISPILWKYFAKNKRNSLSAGRCQSTALRIIYDNYIEINKNLPKLIYNTIGYFTNKNIQFDLIDQFEKEENVKIFLQNSIHFNHIFSVTEPKQTIHNSPFPLITSSLQQISSNELHLSPKETMKFAQELYENGLITYMRTDNKKYSNEFINEIQLYILKEFNDKKLIKNDYDAIRINNNSEKEAHEAIRPVKISLKINDIKENISEKAKKLYHLIWKRTMESCMEANITFYIYGEITAYKSLFRCKAEKNIFLGWKIISYKDKDKDKDNIYEYLLTIKKNTIMNYKKIISSVIMKENILHFTEAKLVQMLEELEIGRPSTFSSIVDKIQDRNYVKKENINGKSFQCKEFSLDKTDLFVEEITKNFGNEKNKLVIQPLGIEVIEFLIKNFDCLFNYEFTKNMENELDNIALGTKKYFDLCNNCYNEIKKLILKLDLNLDLNLDLKKDLIKDKDKDKVNNIIGNYDEEILYIKKGKFGLYAEWGKNKKSLKEFGNRPLENIKYNDVIKILEKDKLLNKDVSVSIGIIRQLSNTVSIRNGTYGEYIFYKTKKMKKPAFYSLTNFKDDVKLCEINIISKWIEDNYHISIN